jgi:hypothetical protein
MNTNKLDSVSLFGIVAILLILFAAFAASILATFKDLLGALL